MRAVTVWEATDGSQWETQAACMRREEEIAEVERAMAPLGPDRPVNGRVYRQLDNLACLLAKRNLLAIARRNYPDCAVWKNHDDDIHPMGIAGRIITDSSGPLATAWSRLMRINWDTFREYEQPYYTNHPDEANTPELGEHTRGCLTIAPHSA